MDNLYEVCNCLNSMDSSKVTERKKGATQLEVLLGRGSITEVIDSNTAQGTAGSRMVTWDVVLKGVIRYLDIEITTLQSAKESQSTTTLNNRDKKKQELSALFRLVIKTANKGNVKLSYQLLAERIESMLIDTYTLESFGTDYCIMFLKYVLRVRQYWLEISPEKWRKLTTLFCKLYDESQVDRRSLAWIIQEVIHGSCSQGEPYPRRIFSFFTRVMENIRDVKDTSAIESILMSLNTFCKTIAPNNRVQLCYFGESQMNGFVFLWNKLNTDKIKEELIQFLHLLVRAHHPHGTTEPGVGAYAHDWDLWKRQVSFLHEMIVTDVDKITDRYKFISGSKDCSLSYIAFAADVFKQMPVSKRAPPDLSPSASQISQSGNQGDAGPTKRQRMSMESKSLVEIISDRSNTLQAIPWLQVLHHLLSKYPESFGAGGLTATVQVMTGLLAECKKGQLFRFIFEALSALIKAVQQFDDLKEQTLSGMTTLWSLCVSSINSRQAEIEGYQECGLHAMACMISANLVSPTKEIWNLFLPSFIHPNPAADKLLTSLITTQGLPENHIPSIVGAPLDKSLRGKCLTFPLRQSLITWLLPVTDTDSGLQFKAALSAVRVAEILHALTLQDPSVINRDLSSYRKADNSSHSSVMESVYLKSTFDYQAKECQASEVGHNRLKIHEKKASQEGSPHISGMLELLVKQLFLLSNNLDQQNLECLSWVSCLLARLLYLLWEESTVISNIQHILKKVLGKMATALVSQLQKQLTASCTSSVMQLNAVLTWEEETNARMFLVTDYIRSCLPSSFVDVLVDVAGGKFNKRNDSKPELSRRPSGHGGNKEPGSTRKVDFDMEFEIFEKIGSSHFSDNNDLDVTFDVEDGINDAEAGAESRQDISNFLSKESLTEADQVQILCSEVLCRMTVYDQRQLDGTSNQDLIRAEMDIDHVVSRLLRLISPECYDPSQSVCVHLLLVISKYFLTCDHEVTLKNIKLILTAFKQTAKELVKDQQVCCQLLSHLRYIIPHLSADEDSTSDELKFCRDVFLKFVSDFWSLASDSTPLLKYEIAQTLLDLLKHDPDCSWGHLQISSSDDGAQGSSLCTVVQHFPKLLTERNIVLRTLVAESLKWLLVRCDNKGSETFRDKSTQKRAFERVFEICSELLDIQQGNLSDQRWQDELHNRQATCLQSLLTIILTSPVCEKPCLLGLCQVVAERNIPLDMVRKMLSIICRELRFVDIKSYLACHLPYLIHNWLHKKMVNSSLSQFPYKLLGYADLEQFVRSHTDLIVSELLITRLNIPDIHAVLNPCHIDVHEALVSALPVVLTHVLPAFAVKLHEPSGSHTSKSFADATDCFTIVVSELSEKTIKDCTYENLGDIIVGVLNCLNIEKDAMGNKSLSMVYPEPNPPHYSQSRIQVTLDYLAQNFIAASAKGTATLITVLAKIPGGLYQVLLSLASLIWQEHRAHNQQRHLQMYRLFVNMLLKELNGGLEGGWASIIREVINRLLIILMDRAHRVVVTSPSYEEDVVLTTLDILHTLCSAALKTCPEEITNYIHRVVDAVADTVTLSEKICSAATDFLTTLLSVPVNDIEDLTKAMRILNPLPVTPGLTQLRAHLEKKSSDSKQHLQVRLENLLEVCLLMSHNPSQGLAIRLNHLASHLAHRHGEIQKLAKTPKGLLILKKILYELIKMATSQHQEVAKASAACLGAIGPIDLQSLSFPHHPVETSRVVAGEVFKSHSYGKYCWLFHALDICLLDKSLDVVKTAGVILKKIMATGSGCRFEAEYSKALKNRSFLFHYLHPFKSIVSKHTGMPPPAAVTQTDSDSFKTLVDKRELWLGCGSNPSHEVWIKNLTTTLLNTGAVQDEILKMIGPMCSLKSDFCEESLPFLIHDILRGGNEEIRHVLSANISSFFLSHCVYSQDSTRNAAAYPVTMNKQSVRTMLNVVQYLRQQSRPKERQDIPQTAWHNNFWIDLDYLQVARAAQYCSANFSAVLFTEIWWETQRNQSSTTGSNSNSQTSDLSQESQLDPLTLVSSQGETGQTVQELLLDVYRSIGDPDGIYGCGAGKLPQPMIRVQTYLHEQQQAKALTTLDIGVSHNTSSVSLLLQAVESCGADYILQRCLSELTYCRDEPSSSSSPVSSTGVADKLQEFFYQSAWRLGQWDVNMSAKQSKLPMFHQSLYRAMVSLKDGHLSIAKQALDMARFAVVSRFDPHVESCKSLYPFLSNLQCLTYLQQVLDIVTKADSSSNEDLLNLFAASSSNNFLSTQAVHFEYEKSLFEIMASMARILTSKGSKQGETLETAALWGLAVGGRKARHFQLAEKALHSLKTQIRSPHSFVTLEHVHLEEAKLFWARNEMDIAKNILKNLIVKLSKDFADDGNNLFLYPEALCTYGNWLAETRSEAPVVIFREYLEKTVDLMNGSNPASIGSDYTALDGYFSLARFADEQYQQIADHLRSPAFEDKQHLLARLRSELKDCQESKTQGKYVMIMERTLNLDSQEIRSLKERHGQFLLQALHNYLACLKSGDVYNLKVFRIVALWFENCKNVKVNALIKEHIGAIQTYKFLPLYYQLAARMSSDTKDNSNFQTVLMQLMQKVAIDHPHHTLWIILALAHAYKDDELLNKGQVTARKKTASGDNKIEEERVQAAKSMLEKLRQVDKKLADIVTNMEKISIAYIELANCPVTNKTDRRPQPLPKQLTILSITDCDNISLPSVELKVDPSGSYKNIISLARFGATFRIAGGLNLPKIITCVGSDGRERTQLVKGKDDLRQDAVMQQVFTLVNELLVGDEETRKRQLKIQTYKVIPLSQKCGLLQWCEGTQPLGEYLIGAKGAHVRYRPGDLSPKHCRDHLVNAGSKPEDKLKVYQEICAKFKPVFHHFFMEHFLEPSVWFEKRLAYTRSVATNSIVGYILGLGDRHLMNILIDLQSAEVVHIDLGIAFEQGRILPTPETVPFRLSRDIVDGMGITGVEGVFRRCCEKTMEVMKSNSKYLLTIVQVLLYDPLSHWSLTPQQALAIQRKREQANLDTLEISLASSGQVPASGQVPSSGQIAGQSSSADKNTDSRESQNKLAERTLLRLRQKLSGQEDGVPLSVTGQVNLLIQKASDPENLCMLYPGWQAYL